MMEFSDLATYAGTGAAGGAGGAGIFYMLIQRLFKRQDALESKVDRLSEERVKNLEMQIVNLQGKCNAETIAADQKNALGWMKKIDLKLDDVKSDTDGMKGTINGQAKWLENIDGAVQKHITNYDIHSSNK